MNKKLIITVLALGIVLSVAVYYALRLTKHDDGSIHVSGNIEVTSVEVSFKIPGRVTERPVDEGEMVEPGELVAKLDPTDLLQEAASRRAEAQASRAQLTELETGYRKKKLPRPRLHFGGLKLRLNVSASILAARRNSTRKKSSPLATTMPLGQPTKVPRPAFKSHRKD